MSRTPTPLEDDSLDVFRSVQSRLSAKKISSNTFMEVMGDIRFMIHKLENVGVVGAHNGNCCCSKRARARAV